MRRRWWRLAWWTLAVAGVSLPSDSVLAYRRATVDGDGSTELWWPARRLRLRIADDTLRDVPPDPLRAAVGRSLATWSHAGGCTDIELIDDGPPGALGTNLMGGPPDGENRIVFREEGWPPELGPETLAITTLVYRRTTGELLDADIDVNGVDHRWSVEAVPPAGHDDVENTVTHELGHFLGFAHVADPNSTMYGWSDPGDVSKRDLSPDDVRGVCDVYPLGGRTPGGEGPRTGVRSGCAAHDAPSDAGAGAALGALIPVVLALGARQRRRRRG